MKLALKNTVNQLYTGSSRRSEWFRYLLITFDAFTILFFVITAPLELSPALMTVTLLVAVAITLDFTARLWIAPDRKVMLTQVHTIADMIVIGSLLLAPFLHQDLGFLRILRGLRLIHSYHLLRDLRRSSRFFRKHEDALVAAVNLFVFVFVTTSVVFALFSEQDAGVDEYIDALYFTVTTLTTTGYGDITPVTAGGKLFAVFIMVVGVALFVQLARAIVQPSKVRYKCPGCGLLRHEQDAVHCKHCGESLKIQTKGIT